ncbi:MAG: stage 0 sporulation family protein [Spirochaetales bacterium]
MSKEKNDNDKEQVQKAYIYLVKTPSSNDLTVCAGESVFYPGTYVVSPTRYGLDMGIVVGSASSLEQEPDYCPGCKGCRGACHFGPTPPSDRFESDGNLAASGDVDDGNVVVEVDGQCLNMGPLPVFSIVSGRVEDIIPEDNEIDDSGLWDSAYKEPELVEIDGDVEWISHMATPEEIKRYMDNKEEENEAIRICREKIARHKLDMKLVTAHFLLCEPKVLFFFTAEDRVDFRDLVKDLVSVFRMRIELRQIGVRDESRVLGGLAVCGRDFCCHCVSDKLKPVTIRMAKEQNLSLNSMKISGPCGRLLCCLSYEYDFYVEEKQAYPQEGSRLKIGNDLFKVTEINILSHKMTVSGSEGRQFQVPRTELFYNHERGRWEVSQQFQDEFLSN